MYGILPACMSVQHKYVLPVEVRIKFYLKKDSPGIGVIDSN